MSVDIAVYFLADFPLFFDIAIYFLANFSPPFGTEFQNVPASMSQSG